MKNLRQVKTTIMGLAAYAAGVAYVFYNEAPDYIVLSILLGGGTLLVFSPDSILTSLRRFGRNVSKDEGSN